MMGIRDFISLLEEAGELVRIIEEVDWKYDIGDRTREAQADNARNKALLFENIRDYHGSRVFTNGLGSFGRIALALGLDPLTPRKKLASIFSQRISHPIEPVLTGDGAFRENILTGDALDLAVLPVPWWNRLDGGRYVGTWHLNLTKDQETGARNVGVYRMQLLNSRQAAISYSDGSDIAHHIAQAEKREEPLEMAVAIGVDEVLVMAASAAFPRGVDEFYPAGGLKTRAIELTKCRTVDIEVPASAEIIIEGHILPRQRVAEGPFVDYLGNVTQNPTAAVFEASCMMYRNNPVFRGAAVGMPGAEDHILFSLLSSASRLDFHGSGAKQDFQNIMFRKGLYKTLQVAFRLRQKIVMPSKNNPSGSS
jgi:UbiD family decarboxylase